MEEFDEVIFACHSDQALKILADADGTERDILNAFPYGKNRVLLHTDTRVLPARRRAWASWNYHVPTNRTTRPTLTWAADLLGVALPTNLVFFIAIGLLFLVSLQYGAELTRVEDKIRTLAEKTAFHEQRIADLETAAERTAASAPTQPDPIDDEGEGEAR